MPNWCHNTLKIEGPRREVERFKNRVSRSQRREDAGEEIPLYFSSLVPEPTYQDDTDWYSWRIENWGSKWEPSFEQPFLAIGSSLANPEEGLGVDQENDLVYEFDTAWSPPNPWVLTASRMFPSLKMTLLFGEPGNCFAGRDVYSSGKLINSEDLEVEEVLPESKMWF